MLVWYSVNNTCLFVCFITKSFLTYSFVLPTPTLSTVCRPLSSYVCSITPETANVGSSYSQVRGPGVSYWFSYHSNCSHWSFEAAVLPINPNIYTDQCEPIVIILRQSQVRCVLQYNLPALRKTEVSVAGFIWVMSTYITCHCYKGMSESRP